MQQHPVPQNVTQYQFRLVGDMTLKQFLELLGGIIGAYLFYSSNLIFVFKWPLSILSLLAGFALAFFPIEDRPLDQWVVNFLRSIYAPTRFIWKKSNKVPHIFTFTAHPVVDVVAATKTVKAPSLSDLQPKAVSDVSDEERQRLNVLDAMLASSTTSAAKIVTSSPKIEIDIEKPAITIHKLKPINKLNTGSGEIFQSATRPVPTTPTQINLDTKTIPTPTTQPIGVAKPVISQVTPKTETNIFVSRPTIAATKPTATATPAQIRLPAAPTSPNLVVGMVVDRSDKIVENVIVQIVNADGVPARAMKTNSLGQFYTSTPLSPGTYVIESEKDGLTFPANKLIIDNKIVPPLLVRAN